MGGHHGHRFSPCVCRKAQRLRRSLRCDLWLHHHSHRTRTMLLRDEGRYEQQFLRHQHVRWSPADLYRQQDLRRGRCHLHDQPSISNLLRSKMLGGACVWRLMSRWVLRSCSGMTLTDRIRPLPYALSLHSSLDCSSLAFFFDYSSRQRWSLSHGLMQPSCRINSLLSFAQG